MKKILYLFVCFTAIALASCSDDDTAPQPTLRLNSSSAGTTVSEDGTQINAAIAAAGAVIDITVQSNWNWSVEIASGNWCAAEITEAGLQLAAQANELTQPRTAQIDVVAVNESGTCRATILVEQAAAGTSSLSVVLNDGDTEILLPEKGGSYRVGVTAGGPWSAATDSNWCKIEQDAEGFTVSAPENTTLSDLTATIRVITGKGTENETAAIPISQVSAANAMVIELTVGETTSNTGALPFENIGVINCIVDWGDGSMQRVVSSWPQHQYSAAGVYEVKIIGKVSSFRANQIPQFSDELKTCVTAIKSWGNIGLESLKRGFYKCTNLRSIAAPGEDSFAQLTTLYECFWNCTALETLPERAFAHAPLLESAYSAFSGCASLKAAPAYMFADSPACTDFFRLFWKCTAMTQISPDLFAGCTAGQKFGQAFYNIPITSIPENLFAPCAEAADFSNTFNGCTELTQIPADLFAKNTAATNLSGAFNGCTALTEIPARIFEKNTEVTNLSNVFANCTKLTAIPAEVFSYATKATNLSGAFNGCTELTEVPAGIFANNTAVTSFANVFANCTKLKTVPDGIFAGMVKVTSFNSAFLDCTGLTSVPVTIFDDAKAVTNFGKTFSGCTALKGESPHTTIEGVKYHLYERSGNAAFTAVKTTAGCFTGCTGLDDYTTISASYPEWL